MKKAKQSRMDYQMAVWCLKATPLDSHLSSPTEILYNRKIRTKIPTLLNTGTTKDHKIQEWLSIQSRKQQQYYNRNSKDLPELTICSKVSVLQEKDTWQPATVIDKSTEPRSYIIIKHSGGKLLRRNRRHLWELHKPQRWVTFNLPSQRIRWDDQIPPSQQLTDHTEIVNTPPITAQHILLGWPRKSISIKPTTNKVSPWKI